jgi:hypothetical protein|tara:strand:- start:78 stop:866 length:789 start_codon:yes stop_codon:yes gene_type:complete
MKKNPKIIINLSVYNSYKNLKKIIFGISSLKLNIVKIFIIDNNSSNTIKQKLSIIKKIKNLYKIRLKLIINEKNYGFGGSQKILFSQLKNEKFDYLVNLGTSGRYNIKSVMLDVKKNINSQRDYYLFSRFLNKKNIINYSKIRIIFNLIFITITKVLTKTYFTDPGQSTYILKKNIINKFSIIGVKNITNNSHFPHFFNIKIFKLNLNYKEIPILWKEGNIKSHLKPASYVLIFMFSVFKYFFTEEFFIEKNNKFKFKKFNF